MFDFSFAELALVVLVIIIFIGPNELPVVVKTISKAMRGIRSLTNELRAAFDDVTQETGLKDAAEEFKRDVRMIRGDDGKLYEAYDMPIITPLKKEGEE